MTVFEQEMVDLLRPEKLKNILACGFGGGTGRARADRDQNQISGYQVHE